MPLRRFFFCVLALFVAAFLVCSDICTDSAEAAVSLPSDGHYMTSSDALALFGQSISCQYYDGSDYQDSTFLYDAVRDVASVSDPDLPLVTDQKVLVYTATIDPQLSPSYVTVKLNPQYSIFDTEYMYCVCGLSAAWGVSDAAYNSPSWKWVAGGQETIFGNTYSDQNGDRRCVQIWTNDWHTAGANCTAVGAIFNFGSSSSCYSVDAQFRGNDDFGDNKFYFFISLPYVSGDAFGSSGTIGSTATSATGTGSGSGGSGTDLTETNGLIGRILAALSSLAETLLEGIEALFIPSEEYLEEYTEDMQDLLEDSLGGVYQAVDLVGGFISGLINVQPKTSIHIDAGYIPLLNGQRLAVGNWDLELMIQNNETYATLYNAIKVFTDFFITTAFLMMLKRKLHVFLSPDSEVISE